MTVGEREPPPTDKAPNIQIEKLTFATTPVNGSQVGLSGPSFEKPKPTRTALMVTAVSDEQIELLRARGVKRVWVLLDGDKGGMKARPAVVEALARSFFVRTVTLPGGGSPDRVTVKALRKRLPWKLKNQF